MEIEYGYLSLFPPILAIILAMTTRQVILSLLAGIWVGWAIIAAKVPLTNPPFGDGALVDFWQMLGPGTKDTISALMQVPGEEWKTRVLVFTLMMGSLLILIQRSGGVEAFVEWAGKWQWAKTRRGAQIMAWIVGLGVFVESTITCLVVGTVARPLFDKLRISREKLAYICDSTSAPVCILLPINGWGATVLGLLYVQHEAGLLGDMGPLQVFLAAVPLNFYAILAVFFVLFIILTGWDFGPMKEAERRAREDGKLIRDGGMPAVSEDILTATTKEGVRPKLVNMFVPLITMLIMVPAGILITGWPGWAGADAGADFATKGQALLSEASGSTSVLWGVIAAVAVALMMMLAQGIFKMNEAIELSMKGAGGLVSLAAIMWLAFAIGDVCTAMGTGQFVADTVAPMLAPWSVAPIVFITASFIAFATGTSWGTFAIMIPLAVPLAAEFTNSGDPISIPLVVAAVLGGGVFGDHCSPISDTSVVSSMAAASDHIDHVRTQLPYALAVGTVACLLYLCAGLI